MVSIFLFFTPSERILQRAEIATADETSMLPNAPFKPQLVLLWKKHKISQAHALLLLKSRKGIFKVFHMLMFSFQS